METLDFKPLDKHCLTLIDGYLENSKYIGSDFSYFGYLIWFDSVEYAEGDRALFLRAQLSGDLRYWQPLVRDGMTVREAVKQLPPCSVLINCTGDAPVLLADDYDAAYDRDNSEYIYLAKDFVSLVGKRYNAKRNHIHKFRSLYNYDMSPYRAEDRDGLLAFEQKWLEGHTFDSPDAERSALREREIMFAAVDASLEGRTVCDILRVDGEIVGFTVGERTKSDSANVIYEKADVSYDGVYSFLAHEFAVRNFCDLTYINRQEDMGLEGLRRSKLSYCPEFLLDKYVLTPKKRADVVSFDAISDGKYAVARLGAEHFNLVMSFLKRGIASLSDKKFFLNYTDGELMNALKNGYMLGAFDGDKLIATACVDPDREYGAKLAEICGDASGRQYYEFSGIMVDADYRCRGISSQLCRLAIDWARTNVAGGTLCAVVQKGNVPSLGNLAKLGFEKRGEASYKEYDFLYLALDI